MIGMEDVVLMLPESYELPTNVGFDALFMLNEAKTEKKLTQRELDILKKCIPTMKKYDYNSGAMINIRAHVLRLKDTKEVIERYNVMKFPYLRMAILPDGLKHIEHEAFRDFDLEYIHIPKSVQYIGSKAFIGCTFAKENFVNDSALDGEKNGYWGAKIVDEEIDGMFIVNDAQNGNTLDGVRYFLPCFNIPNGVELIGKDVFRSGGGVLKYVTIPDSVKNIGEFAFAFCDELQEIVCRAMTPPAVDVSTFIFVPNDLKVYVPQGAVAAYQADADWGKFNIQAIP